MPTLTLPKPHPAQQRVMDEAKRFNVVCCGRRWGKTELGMDRLIHPALEGKPVAWFAPTARLPRRPVRRPGFGRIAAAKCNRGSYILAPD